MKIGVFSDTHGDISNARRFFDRLAPLDCLFHLGDYAADGEKLSKLFDCPVYAVRGNCDYRSDMPLERQVDLGGKRFLLVHGHQYYNFNSLLYRGEEIRADMILFGHTHMPDLSADGPRLILNPGSLSRPRGGFPDSCALILLDGKDLTVRFINGDNASVSW
jgi:putative phosphoesterase